MFDGRATAVWVGVWQKWERKNVWQRLLVPCAEDRFASAWVMFSHPLWNFGALGLQRACRPLPNDFNLLSAANQSLFQVRQLQIGKTRQFQV